MASAWGASWGAAWGVSWGDNGGATPAAPAPAAVVRRGAPHAAERYYLPPGTRTKKKRVLKQLKELYEEARDIIPAKLQAGIIPPEILIRRRATTRLAAASEIDFERLSQSLETIRVLIAAVQDARQDQAKTRKRREEDAILMLLLDVL